MFLIKSLSKCPSSTNLSARPPYPKKFLVAQIYSGIILFTKRSILNIWQCSEYVCLGNCLVICTVTLLLSQPCHILSSNMLKTGNLLKTLWKVDQAYSETCHWILFSHIQAHLEACATLAYIETSHTRNPGIFRTLR